MNYMCVCVRFNSSRLLPLLIPRGGGSWAAFCFAAYKKQRVLSCTAVQTGRKYTFVFNFEVYDMTSAT